MISHLKINLQKSEALNILLPNHEIALVRPNFPFKWEEDSVTYLGTKIPKDLANVFARNFPPLLAFIKLDLKR